MIPFVPLPPGSILVSAPRMLDGNFMHSVVLVVRHGREGSFGFVLNQSTALTTPLLMPDHPAFADNALEVWNGGPVGQDGLQFLHRCPDLVPGGLDVGSGVFLGGDLEALPGDVDAARLARDMRVYRGYSGWGNGQLEGEIDSGGWIVLEPRPELAFEAEEREATWRNVLRSLGDEGDALSRQPPDPTWN